VRGRIYFQIFPSLKIKANRERRKIGYIKILAYRQRLQILKPFSGLKSSQVWRLRIGSQKYQKYRDPKVARAETTKILHNRRG